ncbi:MAG: DUF4435 domain-containing protein [Bacteroidetes bacterium]|nr:DUF4435 domain-containing protein [Bacteroidota bacterium]
MSRENKLTAEIIIETMKRSSLNTLFIEGKDDLFIYRKIQDDIEDLIFDLFPCQGKINLLGVYQKKDSFGNKNLFICDKDMWVFKPSEIEQNEDLITTSGYSIENELFQDSENFILKLFTNDEIEKFNKIIKSICRWFAFEVELYLNNQGEKCCYSNVTILSTSIINKHEIEIKQEFLDSINYTEPNSELHEDISNDYKVKLRGKFIFQAIEKVFQERANNGISYTKKQLFDLIYNFVTKDDSTQYILKNRIEEIKNYFKD